MTSVRDLLRRVIAERKHQAERAPLSVPTTESTTAAEGDAPKVTSDEPTVAGCAPQRDRQGR